MNSNEILKRLNIEALTPMQNESLSLYNKVKDILLLSPTGSGKTLAYLLPLVRELKPEIKSVQAMVIAPSRELALQIESVFRSMKTGMKSCCCYGGHNMRTETNNLIEAPSIIIGTPGRIADHIRRENFDPKSVSHLILDEFDKSLELGFEKEMQQIVESLTDQRKLFLTSATNLDRIPEFLNLNKVSTIDYLDDKSKTPDIKHSFIRSEGSDKAEALENLINKIAGESVIVFFNHRDAVERIGELIGDNGICHEIFHGGMQQHERERAVVKFRNGSSKILLTTDLAARGLDIPEIRNVVHYQLPQSKEAYIHRNGRTARMMANGNSFIILAEDEPIPVYIDAGNEIVVDDNDFTQLDTPQWETIYIGAGKKDKVNKIDIVGFLIKQVGLTKDDIGKIDVFDKMTYVAVKRNLVNKVLKNSRGKRIKKRIFKVQISK